MNIKLKQLLIKTFFLAMVFFLSSQLHPQTVSAQGCPPQYAGCSGGCTHDGQCINNKICTLNASNYLVITNRACGSTVMGRVDPPQGVADYNLEAAANGGQIGIMLFFSRILKIFTIISGLIIMANFIMSGVEFISSAGNTEVMGKVNKRLTYSLVGIAIIVGAYAIAGILSLIFFGDAGFILNPNIEQYGALAP